ncbi:hypothetical protein AVEN_204977-1 [Araneus ventricosus]|uniref:Uncharacterized protein n=1 Tax=Araneus ventricosus TaxID=182803 RepID=A0A4Y2SGJ8_ARAVE|nr:hypothetical protein AVEN_204977-1 [Araneus ventricosus]
MFFFPIVPEYVQALEENSNLDLKVVFPRQKTYSIFESAWMKDSDDIIHQTFKVADISNVLTVHNVPNVSPEEEVQRRKIGASCRPRNWAISSNR